MKREICSFIRDMQSLQCASRVSKSFRNYALAHAMRYPVIVIDHSWDFRLMSDTEEVSNDDDVKDSKSGLMARLQGSAVRSTKGLLLDGGTESWTGLHEDGGHAVLDDWTWGGTTSIETYVKYERFNLASRVFDFSGEGYDDSVHLFNRGTSSIVGEI